MTDTSHAPMVALVHLLRDSPERFASDARLRQEAIDKIETLLVERNNLRSEIAAREQAAREKALREAAADLEDYAKRTDEEIAEAEKHPERHPTLNVEKFRAFAADMRMAAKRILALIDGEAAP